MERYREGYHAQIEKCGQSHIFYSLRDTHQPKWTEKAEGARKDWNDIYIYIYIYVAGGYREEKLIY